MDIDRERVSNAFRRFLASYDMNHPHIKIKAVHTFKTAENCELIAKTCGKDADLAWLTGILHDVGRFPQMVKYDTFWDPASTDHAALGADILFRGGLIKEFIDDDSCYPILEKAVRWHSAYRLPEDLTSDERAYCLILRDADKLDIFRVFAESDPVEIFRYDREKFLLSPISDEVMEEIRKRKTVKHTLKKTPADRYAGVAALGFELNFPVTERLVRERGDLDKYLSIQFKNKDTDRKRLEIRELLGL
ncbi:MAG: HD domain-containing protein [Anaerovoracaceae bacterium]|jgi:hypothetical protein